VRNPHPIHSSRDLLVHLHGSVKFGYKPRELASSNYDLSEIVKYADSSTALNSWNIGVVDNVNQGSLIPATPIISGFSKTEKLQERPVPFGYYLNAFVESLTKCGRVLIIGYGGRDEYINTWLQEHQKIHKHNKEKRRISIINRLLEKPGEEHVRNLIDSLAEIERDKMSNAHHKPADIKGFPEVWEEGDMQVVCSGFPVSDKTSRDVVEFLRQNAKANNNEDQED
jgi:hypothetical protein